MPGINHPRDLLGSRAPSPAMSAKREKIESQKLRLTARLRAGVPAVPADLLNSSAALVPVADEDKWRPVKRRAIFLTGDHG